MSTKTAAVATAAVDVDQLARLLDTGKIDIATVFQRVAEGGIEQATAAAAVAQHTANATAAAALAAAGAPKALHVKCSAKGTNKNGDETKGGSIGIYGINAQFPIGTYAEGWFRIISMLPAVLDCIATDANVTAKNITLQQVRDKAKAYRTALAPVVATLK